MINLIEAVKVIVENEAGQILLLKRSKTAPRRPLQWDLPGGFVDEGEDNLVAAIREVQEEAQIDVSNLIKVHYQEKIRVSPNLMANSTYYKAVIENNVNPILSYEHVDYCWVDPNEAVQKLEFAPQINMFKVVYGLSDKV